MKICLLSPPDLEIPYHPPDIGLGYLASSLKPLPVDVVILNPNQYKSREKIITFLSNERIDVVGIKIITRLFFEARDLLTKIKEKMPAIITVIGGPHPSGVPKKTMEELASADFLFAGEADIGFPLLLRSLKNSDSKETLKNIPGLTFRVENRLQTNLPVYEADINKFSMPAWELMRPNDYPVASMCRFFKTYPIAPIIATRGCPCLCTFCSASKISGKNIRFKNVSLVLKEISYLKEKQGVLEFQFVDDNLTFDRKYIKEFCTALIVSNMNIAWSCPNGIRLDTVDEEILVLMKRSGCHTVCLGIESGSDGVLKSIKKSVSVKIIKEQISLIKKTGILTVGMFVIGLPGETQKEVRKTIDFALTLPLDGASFMICSPLPGSTIYNEYMEDEGPIDWKQFGYKGTNRYNFSKVTYARLKAFQQEGYIKFHLQPRIIGKTLMSLRSLSHVVYFAKRIYRGFLLS